MARLTSVLQLWMMMINGSFFRRGVAAWLAPSSSVTNSVRHFRATSGIMQRKSSWNDNDDDEWGGGYQRTSRKSDNNNRPGRRGGDDNSRVRIQRGPFEEGRDGRPPRNKGNDDRRDWRRDNKNEGVGERRRMTNDNNNRWDRNGPNSDRNQKGRRGKMEDPGSKIDMKALEAEGFVHLYGLAPILSALKSNHRDFSPRESEDEMIKSRFGDDEGEDEYGYNDSIHEEKKGKKPEAQFTPWLFLQDRSGGGGSERSGDKEAAAAEVKTLAEELGIPIHYTDKGSLNALSGNRPHQGFVLRCGALEFETLSRIPLPDPEDPSIPNLWLVLDEVVDPQNLGALLRSSYFLGGSNNQRMGILVCSKNSAPPSPVVSAASAGALELLDVYSTSSLPRTLSSALDDGFRIIGAASSKPRAIEDDESIQIYDLQDLPLDDKRPTLLVLGSEGHGLRTLVAKLCTEFVRIPRGDGLTVGVADEDARSTIVDSLNVSVTGGILLWHLLYGTKSQSS